MSGGEGRPSRRREGPLGLRDSAEQYWDKAQQKRPVSGFIRPLQMEEVGMRKNETSKVIERILLVMLCISVILMLSQKIHVGLVAAPDKVTELSDGWYYTKDGVRVDVRLPQVIREDSGDSLTLYHDGLVLEEHKMLTTRGAVYRLKIAVGQEELYAYNDVSFPRNVQMASKVNCTAELPGNMEGKTLALTFENTKNGVYEIGPVYIGSTNAVFLHHCAKDLFSFAIVFAMAILCVITVWISLYLGYKQVGEKRFADITCFLLCCGCWFLTDSSTVQTLSGSSPIIRYISFYAFMLLAVPMLYFVKNTGELRQYRIIDFCIYAFYGNAILQSLLNYFRIFDFVDMLFVTHLLLVGGIFILVTLLLREYRKNGDKEILTILQSFVVVAGGGVISLLLYWLLEISYYEVFFELGIVIFIILLIRSLLVKMVENLQFRTEMQVYQRLSKEDSLTGLKNRRSFDEFMAQVEQKAAACQTAYLVFMDVNQLKVVNDNFGHNMGDELIIAAARCIDRAFGTLGSCFRIGGDEFCAVLLNNGESEGELSRRLDEEIEQYNKANGRCRLSLARGISSIREPDGTLKTISDWKRDADMKMYHNKGWIRRKDYE